MRDYGGRVLIVDLLGNSNENAGVFLDTFGNNFSVIPLDAIDPLAFDKAYRKSLIGYPAGYCGFV